VVNKVDAVRGRGEVPQLAAAETLGEFVEIIPVAAATGSGVDILRGLIVARLPEGPPLYPADEVTDQPIEARLAELIREQALRVTHQEVPHSIAVVVDELARTPELVTVHASLIVERDSQKGIVIGSGGATLQAIGSRARVEMELLLGSHVYLDLHVKVLKEWQRDPRSLDRLGF
jgi:GTP-binding protein Era